MTSNNNKEKDICYEMLTKDDLWAYSYIFMLFF